MANQMTEKIKSIYLLEKKLSNLLKEKSYFLSKNNHNNIITSITVIIIK